MQNSKPAPRGGHQNKSVGKRKLSDQDSDGAHHDDPGRKQATITDLFSSAGGNNVSKNARDDLLSPNSKRVKREEQAGLLPPQSQSVPPDPIDVDSMYKFERSETSKSGRGGAGLDSSPSSSSTPAQMLPPAPSPSRAYTSTPRETNFTPHTGARKLVVKNLRSISRLDQDRYFDKIWAQLETALTAIFADEKPRQSLEELYRGAENVCRQGRSAALARKLQDVCKDHVSGKVLRLLLARSQDAGDIEVLKSVEEAWRAWNARLVTIRSIFYYLDQSFLLHSADHPTIYEMGLIQFRAAVFRNEILKPKILQGACKLIDLDRKEDKTSVDPTLLRRAIKFFHDLGVYTKDFEPKMLAATEEYVSSWASKESTNNYLATYAERCHRLSDREMARCDFFALDRSTKVSISQLLDRYLVSEQLKILLEERDILGLLRTNDKLGLEHLYSLLDRQDLGARVKPAFMAYIVEEGSTIVFDQERESEMVLRLLKFKEDLDEIWRDSFHKNEVLGHTLREAFETFINQGKKTGASWGTDNPKPGEMIAKHVDLLLRGGVKAFQGWDAQSKGGNSALADEDAEINKQLDQVLDLFRFVHGKAVFEAFYKNDLARRLLMGRSASDEAEKSMLARLKSECGSNFTHNLESMFKDMDLARDEMTSYNALQGPRRNRPKVDLNVHVISAAAWPSYPDVPVMIPKDISAAMDSFDQFYNNKYNGRKLLWKHSLAHCQLKARFPKGDKEIVVSSFQAIVLLLFNDTKDEALSYQYLKEATGLPEAELKRTLQSLACAKYRVLSKKPKGKDINDTDTFTYNSNFSDPKMRIKINQIQLKETKQENKTTHERVAADRHYETQAAIVRIMKARKTIRHAELVAEVINKTKSRGVLDPADIKKNIEKLIDKDYIERDGEKGYRYLS